MPRGDEIVKGARARGRDEASEQALAAAFDKGGAERVTQLYWRDDLPEDQCWLRAAGLVSGLPLMHRTLHQARPGRGGGRAVGSLFPLEGGMGLRSGVYGADARRPRGPSQNTS